MGPTRRTHCSDFRRVRRDRQCNPYRFRDGYWERYLEKLETMEDSNIMLCLGVDVDLLKRIIRQAETNNEINKKLLKVLEKGFRSLSTPASMLTVVNTVIEMDFIFHSIRSIETYFENDRYNENTLVSVLRILIKMYSFNESPISFINKSFDCMSDVMETVRDTLKVDKVIKRNNCKQNQEINTYATSLQTYLDNQQHNHRTYSASELNYQESQSDSEQDNSEIHSDREQNITATTEATNTKYEDLAAAFPKKASDITVSLNKNKNERFKETQTTKLIEIELLFVQLVNHRQECISGRSKRKADHIKDREEEDFRKIPIYPRLGDLNGNRKPNLRKNKAKGGYSSVDDYLDVQFRLLREDFVGSLRKEIFAIKGQTCGKYKKQIQGIKAYENVWIESFVCGDGLNHVLRFDDRKMKHIRWNLTKRLKYGTLVCLSADDFKTCYFATVVNSDIKFRREGRVHVKFAHESNIIKELIGLTFTMIESTAYFEAYWPVHASIQTITDLPFQEYLVKCNVKVLPPKYLRQPDATIFDLRCLLEPDFKIHNDFRCFRNDNQPPEVKNVFRNDSRFLMQVNILENKWPKEEMIPLDHSQLNALKSALTKEFCIIQGPPGCGKTHIGLEITKVLLHNKYKWGHENGSRAQILVVSKTNLALDQFMDGVRSFFIGDILRVGNRCSNENLKQYNLKAIKNQYRKERKFPFEIYQSRVLAKQIVESLKKSLDIDSMKIRILRNNIIHEKSLIKEMGNHHSKHFCVKQKKTSTSMAF